MLTVGVPLWIAGWTTAPAVTVAVLLALNTVIVSLLQVWAVRGARDLPAVGRSVARAGVMLAGAWGLYAAAIYGGVAVVVVNLAPATVAHQGVSQTGAAARRQATE